MDESAKRLETQVGKAGGRENQIRSVHHPSSVILYIIDMVMISL